MTTRDNCAVVFIVYALIDTNKQEGLDILNDTLDVLGITFQDFMEYIEQIPKTESSRFAVYSEIKKLSSQDKGLVRKLMVDAYMNGGKKGDASAAYYFKEIIENCGLATATINI